MVGAFAFYGMIEFFIRKIEKEQKKKSLMPFDFNAYFISLPKL